MSSNSAPDTGWTEALVWWLWENTDVQEVGREFELSPGYWMDGSFGLVVMGEY